VRRCLFALLLTSALSADEHFSNSLGTQGLDLLGGVQHTSAGTDPVGGFRILGGLGRFVSGYVEYTYSRPVSRTFLSRGNNAEFNVSLMDYGGGLELHANRWRVSPYIYGGIGGVRTGASVHLLGRTRDSSVNNFAGSVGGGVRVYVNQYYGFMAEVKGLRPTDSLKPHDSRWIERYALGVFLRFPPPIWPSWKRDP